MAQPIRWDNINAPNLSEASRPLESAQRSFLGAFDTIGNTLTQRQGIEDANWQNTKSNNTNAFLDAVAKYRSPEELRAAQAQGGALDQLRQQYGNQVDPTAIRGAADSRVAALQQQNSADIAYQGVMRNEKTAPQVDALRSAILTGDKEAENAARAKLADAGYRDFATQNQFADTFHREQTVRDQADKTFANQSRKSDDDHSLVPVQRDQLRAAIAASQAGVRASDSQVNMNNFTIDNTKRATDAALAAGRSAATKVALKESGNVYADGVYNGTQADDLLGLMTKNGVGNNAEQRTKVIAALNKLQANGIEITAPDGKTKTNITNIPMSAVTAAVNASHNGLASILNPFSWNQGFATSFEDNLKQILQAQSVDADGTGHSKIADDLSAYTQAIQNARQNAPGIVPNRTPRGK